MPDPIVDQPRLADIYDDLDPERSDLPDFPRRSIDFIDDNVGMGAR